MNNGETEEPVLEEVLDSPALFRSLLRFLSAEMAHENALFLKEVRLFDALRAPAAATHAAACRIYFAFVAPGAPMAVNVGAETQDAVRRALWAGWRTSPAPPRVFGAAWAEIRALIAPACRRWLAQRAWTRLPWARLRPPAFAQVLRTPALVASRALCGRAHRRQPPLRGVCGRRRRRGAPRARRHRRRARPQPALRRRDSRTPRVLC